MVKYQNGLSEIEINMTNIIHNLVNMFSERKQKRLREWKVAISDSGYDVFAPFKLERLLRPVSVKEEVRSFSELTLFEVKIISLLHQQFMNSHTFLRLYTYYSPKELGLVKDKCQLEQINIKDKDFFLFLIHDCQDEDVWKASMNVGTFDCGKMLYTLSYQPQNSREITESMFNIIEKHYQGSPIQEFKSELALCQFLCYSVDANLVIAKVDLQENAVLSILEDVARDEGLDLIVERRA